jgi:hypothetical protein
VPKSIRIQESTQLVHALEDRLNAVTA